MSNISSDVSDLMIWIRVAFEPKWGNAIVFPRAHTPFEADATCLFMSCAKNHDIERRRAVVKLPRAREKEREEDTVCSVVHNIFSRDVISEIHTRETQFPM